MTQGTITAETPPNTVFTMRGHKSLEDGDYTLVGVTPGHAAGEEIEVFSEQMRPIKGTFALWNEKAAPFVVAVNGTPLAGASVADAGGEAPEGTEPGGPEAQEPAEGPAVDPVQEPATEPEPPAPAEPVADLALVGVEDLDEPEPQDESGAAITDAANETEDAPAGQGPPPASVPAAASVSYGDMTPLEQAIHDKKLDVAEASLVHARAKAAAGSALKVFNQEVKSLEDLCEQAESGDVRPDGWVENSPLAKAADLDAEQAALDHEDREARFKIAMQAQPLATLGGINPGTLTALANASPPVETVGEFHALQKKHGEFWNASLKGVGPGGKQKIEDKVHEFVVGWSAANPEKADEEVEEDGIVPSDPGHAGAESWTAEPGAE